MRISRNLWLSCEILAAHKLRSLLAVTGVIVGVAAVILTVSAGRGAEENILARLRSMGNNVIVVSAGQTVLSGGRARQLTVVKTLLPADADAIRKECPSVALASPAAIRKMSAYHEDLATTTTIIGLAPEGLQIRGLEVGAGRPFEAEESHAARRVALVGRTVARNLFEGADPVGQELRIGKVPFEVVGVLAPKGADPNGADQDDLVIIPLETAMHRLLNVTYVQSIYVQAASADAMDRAEREIDELLHLRHRLGAKDDDFTIQNQNALLKAERDTGRSLTFLTGSAAGISLAVGGVGILAVMLMAVRERRREIGLRRAVGARRRDITAQFLLESGLLAGLGGLMGVAAGVGAAMMLSYSGYWAAIISWSAVAVAFSFSVVVGVVFGLYPARQAARLEPIQSLRAES